jgi:hypothetical protein
MTRDDRIGWLIAALVVGGGFLAIDATTAEVDAHADLYARRERACVAVVECRTWLASCFATQRHESTCVDRAARLGFVPGVRP